MRTKSGFHLFSFSCTFRLRLLHPTYPLLYILHFSHAFPLSLSARKMKTDKAKSKMVIKRAPSFYRSRMWTNWDYWSIYILQRLVKYTLGVGKSVFPLGILLVIWAWWNVSKRILQGIKVHYQRSKVFL